MDNKLKEAVLILVFSLGLFIAFKPKKDKAASNDSAKKTFKKPKESEIDFSSPIVEDAYVSLCAYIDAYNDGVTQKELDELNAEVAKKYNMQIVRISSSELAVEDLKGNEILSAKV